MLRVAVCCWRTHLESSYTPYFVAIRRVWSGPGRPGAGDGELDDGVAAAAVRVHLNSGCRGSNAGSGWGFDKASWSDTTNVRADLKLNHQFDLYSIEYREGELTSRVAFDKPCQLFRSG